MTFSLKYGVHAWAEEGRRSCTLNDLLRDCYSMFARPAYLLVSVLWLRLANGQLIQGKQLISVAIWPCIVSLLSTAGDPPAFESFEDPRDQFVFERDADGNQVSLMFTCLATGTDLTINW